MNWRIGVVVALVLSPALSWAEQPVFGMMPRWDNGWGMQFEHEHRSLDSVSGHILHVEGVYTWKRWIRATYKLPYVVSATAAGSDVSESGMGTPILALPLKKYYNHDGKSGAFGFTPSVYIPIGSTALGSSHKVAGLGASWGQETYRTTIESWLGLKIKDDMSTELGGDAAIGGKFYPLGSLGNFRLTTSFNSRSGDLRVRVGAATYLRLTDRWHAQVSYKRAVIADGYDSGHWFRSGLGMVF